jgi:hypothetical protein
MAVKKRFWTLLARREGRFLPEFGSFARGDVIVKMSELRRKGVPRSDLKIIASDPDLAAITKDVEALNDANCGLATSTGDPSPRSQSRSVLLSAAGSVLRGKAPYGDA